MKYDLYIDDTKRKPWSFSLFDDIGNVLVESKQYKTKAAAASVAARRLAAILYVATEYDALQDVLSRSS